MAVAARNFDPSPSAARAPRTATAPGRGLGLQTQRHVSPQVAAAVLSTPRVVQQCGGNEILASVGHNRPENASRAYYKVASEEARLVSMPHGAERVRCISPKRGRSLYRGAANTMLSLRRITASPRTGLVVRVRRPANPKDNSLQDNARTA
jgi:hypothetical protein